MPKQQLTRDVRNFFKVSPLKIPDGIELTREQKLAQRIEDRRTSFEKEKHKAGEAKNARVEAEEREFDAMSWRREWRKSNLTEMASREVKRQERLLLVLKDEEAVTCWHCREARNHDNDTGVVARGQHWSITRTHRVCKAEFPLLGPQCPVGEAKPRRNTRNSQLALQGSFGTAEGRETMTTTP